MRLAILALVISAAACGKVDTFTDAAVTCDQEACGAQDGCCPASCNANNDSDCAPVCGNGVVEAGETCDGDCSCPAETYSCFTETGDAAHCNLACHVPVQTCGGVDGCCPYIENGNGTCGNTSDIECAGAGWQVEEWPVPQTWAAGASATINVYGLSQGESVLFTTCTPNDGSAANTVDTLITSVVDSNNTTVLTNADDSTDAGDLPRLAGWNCAPTGTTSLLESTAPPNDGGVIVGANVYKMTVTLTGHAGAAGTNVRFFIWWNGTGFPNQG